MKSNIYHKKSLSSTSRAKEGVNLFDTIINRIKEIENVEKDKDVALLLKMDPRHLAVAKSSGSVPYDRIVEYSRARRVSLEYLLNGNGPSRITDMAMEPGAIYRVHTDQDAVYEIAGMVYKALLAEDEEMGVTWEKFMEMVKFVHRDMLDRGESKAPPYERVLQFVKAATP